MAEATGITIFIIFVCLCMLVTWAIVGGAVVFYLDVFGKRYDYEKDYPLTTWQKFLAGPLIWWMEWGNKKRG